MHKFFSSLSIVFLLIFLPSPILVSAAELPEIPGLQVWLKSDNTAKDGNSRVNTWTDSSGKENDFSQQNTLRQPVIIEDSINGFPSVQFLGNDFLDSSSISALNTPRITSFIVFKMLVPPGRQDVIFSSYRSGAGKNSDQFWGVFGEYPNFGAMARKSDGSAKTVTRKIGKNWAVFSMVWNSSAELNAWLDGFSGRAATGANAVPAGHLKTRIGASTDNPKHFSKIGISEILIYNRALTGQERVSVEEYLQDKYFSDNSSPQITAVSAIGNPYKVMITSNEDLNEAEAEIISNYSIDHGINITGAVLGENGNRIELVLDKPLSENTSYVLKVNNLRDLSGNVVPDDTEAVFDYVDIPSDDMVLWLRADSFVATDAEGGIVSWGDQSGNSNRALVPSTNLSSSVRHGGCPEADRGVMPRVIWNKKDRPVLTASALNGKPVISFSGEKALLKCSSIPALETDRISWFVVLKTNSPDETQGVLVGSYSEGAKGNSDEMWGSIIRDNDLFAFARARKGSMVSAGHPLDNGWHIQSAVWKEDNSVEAHIDGNMKMTSPGASAVPDKHNSLFIGAENSKGRHPFSGQIAEIIVYSNELPDAERMKIEAYLESKYFTVASIITASAGANGSISPSGAVSVNNGEGQLFTITADANYHVSDVLVDGVSVGAVAIYQFTNVTTAHTISASFAIDTHNVTFDLAGKGERTGGGELIQAVNHGSGATAPAITANAGWTFTGWDKAFDSITADTTVTAQYSIVSCTITSSAGANGSITPTGAVPVEFGASQFFATAANAGYHVADVFVDGVSIGAVAGYQFTNVTADHTISASFAINTYTLAYTAVANGSIAGTTPQTVNHGADGSPVTAVPNEGYHFTGWSDFSTANPRTDTAVTGNISVTANFAVSTYTVTFDCGYNGSLQGETSQTVDYNGACSTVTAVPDAGYRLVKWVIEPSANASASDFNSPAINVENVRGDCTVTATFCLAAQDILINGGNLYTKSRAISIDPLVFSGTQYANVIISESPAMDNSQTVQNPGAPFTWQMSGTQERSYMLYFRYVDGAGVSQGEIMPRQVILDTTPPLLDIISPTDGGTTDQGFVRLELTAFDPSPSDPSNMNSGREVKVFVNGERKENLLENRIVIDRLPVSGAGANNITITVEDEAGNVTGRTVTWTVDLSSDTLAPTVSGVNITEDTDSGVGTGVTTVPDVSEIWVQGTVDDPKANVRYSVNAGESREFNIRRNNAGNYQFCGLVPLNPGANTLAIEAYDLAGNVSSYSHALTRSTHMIEITSHTPESFANGAPQNISGKISSMIGGAPLTGIAANGMATASGDLSGNEPVTAVTVNGVPVASGDLVDNGDGTLTFTANAVPPAPDGSMTSIDVGAETASGKKYVANATRIEGYEILHRNVIRSWSQKWHIEDSRTNLNFLFGDIDLYAPGYNNSGTQTIRYFAPNQAMFGATVGDPDITSYPPLGSFWEETGMDEFPVSGDSAAIVSALVANKDGAHLFEAGMWKEYSVFSGNLGWMPDIDVLY
ncbi:MAG: InlB B-repeat-containing protein, partial [Victivallales bacterium]